jgi:hypothetical protein
MHYRYTDELLVSCLKLVLSVPKEFLDLPLLVPALQTALKLGVSHLPLSPFMYVHLEAV